MKKISLLFVLCALVLAIVGCTTKVTVEFDTAGGEPIASVEINSGDTVALPTPVRDGYQFVGWLLNGEPFDASTKVEKNIVLTAKWKKENPATFHITFMVDEKEYAKKDCLEEEFLTDLPKDPTKENCSFVGWFVGDKVFDFEKTPITSDLVVTAHFDQTSRIVVMDVDLPTDLITYMSNKKEKENKRTEFMDLTVDYMVGTDNPWKIKPNVDFQRQSLINPDEFSDVIVNSWEYQIRIYQLTDTTSSLIDLETSDLIDDVDTINCLIDFSEKAAGQSFRIEVVPTGLTEVQKTEEEDYTISFEVSVVDGYNVYNAKELAYMDNRTSGDEANAWNDFKDAHNLKKDYAPNSLILHTNIDITKDDLPAYFFYTSEEVKAIGTNEPDAVGSMKDWKDMYYRSTDAENNFGICGNYYTLSTDKLKEVVIETDAGGAVVEKPREVLISHATLIRFVGAGNTSLTGLNLVGNSPRTDDLVKSGGQILIKIEGPNFVAYNNISTCFFITYMPNRTDAASVIEKCRAYDNFNCFVYNWGSPNVTISHSEMIGAGGPIIIQDHVEHDVNGEGGYPSSTKIVESKLESYVTGSEGWFTAVGATALIPAVTGIGTVLQMQGQRSFLTTSLSTGYENFNFICVNKSGTGETVTENRIKGSLQIDQYPAFDYGESNPMVKQVYEGIFAQHAPMLQTTAGGIAFFDGKTVKNPLTQSDCTTDDNIFKGDYIGIYYNGMFFVLGYYAVE